MSSANRRSIKAVYATYDQGLQGVSCVSVVPMFDTFGSIQSRHAYTSGQLTETAWYYDNWTSGPRFICRSGY
jgi:hypothetical protein